MDAVTPEPWCLLGERWLPVLDYVSLYEVSDYGRSRSLDRTRARRDGRRVTFKGKILKATPNSNGYPVVNLCVDGTSRPTYVHRLVLLAFEGPCPAGHMVRHLDGNPSNARLDNLKYGLPSENSLDMTRHGTNASLRVTHCPYRHPLVEPNLVRSLLPNRICRACHYARGALYDNPALAETGSHQARSNLALARIMAGALRTERPRGSDFCRNGHPLIPVNLVRSSKTPSCLACSRTYGVVLRARARGEEPDFQAISDAKFDEIAGLARA